MVHLQRTKRPGADEAARRYSHPQPCRSQGSKGVQLLADCGMLRQRAMAAQKAQAGVLLHRRLHYALPGWHATAERRDAQGEFHSAA